MQNHDSESAHIWWHAEQKNNCRKLAKVIECTSFWRFSAPETVFNMQFHRWEGRVTRGGTGRNQQSSTSGKSTAMTLPRGLRTTVIPAQAGSNTADAQPWHGSPLREDDDLYLMWKLPSLSWVVGKALTVAPGRLS
jgi:hypothetical protein